MKNQRLRIVALIALAAFVVAVWKFSVGVVWDTIFLTVFVAGLVSAWIAGLRMKRKIRGVLGREATARDMTSIKTWITVDERQELAGDARVVKAIAREEDLNAEVAIAGASGSSGPLSLFSHSYANCGKQVVPTTFGAGKAPYVLMVMGPIFLILWVGPASVSRAPWFHLAVMIYALFVVSAVVCLSKLKLEISAAGIAYASLFCRGKSISFSDISSAVVLTDPHYRTQWWPQFNWYDLLIMPKPETGKTPIKIAFLLFPSEAREQLIRLLKPEELDTGGA